MNKKTDKYQKYTAKIYMDRAKTVQCYGNSIHYLMRQIFQLFENSNNSITGIIYDNYSGNILFRCNK